MALSGAPANTSIWTPYGLLPYVSEQDRSWRRLRSDAVVYPACDGAVIAPGHHGHPRTEGQSLNSDLRGQRGYRPGSMPVRPVTDRKSTRLNSRHGYISYAV